MGYCYKFRRFLLKKTQLNELGEQANDCLPTFHLFKCNKCCSDGAQRWDRTTDTRIFSYSQNGARRWNQNILL